MRVLENARNLFGKLKRFLQRDEFDCEDCERRDQCGLPPDKECIDRLEQIARKKAN